MDLFVISVKLGQQYHCCEVERYQLVSGLKTNV